MLNTLSSYLFGTFNGEATDGVEETTVRLTSVMTEGDWVLVDRDSEGNSESGSSCEENWDDYPLTNRLSRQSTRNNSTISLPCAIMEESWFVTPPPCFTCTEPILMETSPLENLLIEHPSMSVYHQHSFPIRPLTPIKETKSERLTRSLRQEIIEHKEAVYAAKRPKDVMSHSKKQEREHVIQEPLLICPHVVKAQKVIHCKIYCDFY